MLNSNKYVPESRANFLNVLQNVQAGQYITLPYLGQLPNHFGEGTTLFVTQQMMNMWQMLSADQPHSIKRVLSGPMGVGKSYLALFLAAKAYSENWLMLYISDAAGLDKPSQEESSEQVCIALFSNQQRYSTCQHSQSSGEECRGKEDVALACIGTVWDLLKQKIKPLLVVDGHSSLSRPSSWLYRSK